MNRPDIKNSKYYSGHIFLDQKYMDDQNKYIEQIEKQLQKQCIINLSQAERADEVREEKKVLIKAYEDYLNLIGEELNELMSIATIRGWKSSRYESGKKLRENIQKVANQR